MRQIVEAMCSHCGILPPMRKPVFVHMFDWGRRNQVTHGIREGLEALGAVMADPGDSRRGIDEMHAEWISHCLATDASSGSNW